MPDSYGKYSYFDTPDGKDAHKKAWYISKYLAKLGVFSGTVDAFAVTRPQSKLGVILVYAKHIGILVSGGLAFTSVTFISTDLRKKDDGVNHAVGALAASAMVGAAVSNPWVFATLSFFSVPAFHENKNAIMKGVNWWKLDEELRKVYRKKPLHWNTSEADVREVSLKDQHARQNEAFYKKRREGSEV